MSPVALRVDAHPSFGVGHAVRTLALAEELVGRGVAVTLLGDLGGIDWVETLAAETGVPVQPAVDVVAQAGALGADAVVLDGYHLDPGLGAALRATGVRVLAMVDGAFGAAQEADLYVDQNLGATPRAPLPAGSVALAGIELAMFRDTVLRRRRTTAAAPHDPPRVLCVFGGTDPQDAARVVLPAVLDSTGPVQVVAVTARNDIARYLQTLPVAAGQSVQVHPPTPDLAGLAVTCDAAISAAGSSVWELLCLGVPTGVVCVADNQLLGYRATTEAGVVLPIGLLRDLAARPRPRIEVEALLAGGPEQAARGQALVDGHGRARVADALLRPSTGGSSHSHDTRV